MLACMHVYIVLKRVPVGAETSESKKSGIGE